MTKEEEVAEVEVIEPGEGIDSEPDEEAVIQTLGQVSIYRSTDPGAQLEEARARAKVLVDVVTEQNLASSFGQGRKKHVNVEGWQFLASQFGLIPDIEWTKELEDGWEARAALVRLSDGQVIAHGDAECRTSESNWKNRDSYALRSMAQTRAVSKVCRIALSSVMVMAGFNATPAEEMDGEVRKIVAPESPEEPHCPACLAINGELVALSGPHDRKPIWRCTNRAEDCAGGREYQGKTYSWSGWQNSWKESIDEWKADHPSVAGAQERSLGERGRRFDYILDELKTTLIDSDEDTLKEAIRNGIDLAVRSNAIDPEQGVGEPILELPLTADQLNKLMANMTPAEADIVISAALEVLGFASDPAYG